MALDPDVLAEIRFWTSRNEAELPDEAIEMSVNRVKNIVDGEMDLNAVLGDLWMYLSTNVTWGSRTVGNVSLSRPLAWGLAQYYLGLSSAGIGATLVEGWLQRLDRGTVLTDAIIQEGY